MRTSRLKWVLRFIRLRASSLRIGSRLLPRLTECVNHMQYFTIFKLVGSFICYLVLGPLASATPLTLAIADLPSFSTALIAEDQGFFAAEGLELKTIHCVNGKRCLKHLLDGEAQYATVADTPIALAAMAGSKFEILSQLATTSRENHFLARSDRGIRTAADLAGKRIGILKGTSAHSFVNTLLLFNGIGQAQVTLVPLDVSDPAGALIRGDVDAAGLYNPVWLKAQAAIGKQLVSIQNPNTFSVTTNIVGITRAAGGKEADAIKLLRALKRADRLIDDDPARARAIIATRLKLAQADVDAMWADYDFKLTLTQPLISALEAQTRWALRESLVPDGKMPDYLDYVDVVPLIVIDPKAVSVIK